MSLQNKALLLGGAGIVASVGYGLLQPKSSPTVREQLGYEGYELISGKNKEDEIWKNRATLYNASPKNQDILFDDLAKVNEKGDEIKAKCEQFTDGKTTMKTINSKIYEKITKLCTLTIKEYVELHLSGGDEFIKNQGADAEWESKFKKYEEKMKEAIEGISSENSKTKIPEYCDKVYELQKSNKHSTENSNARDWCIKRKESLASPDLKLSED